MTLVTLSVPPVSEREIVVRHSCGTISTFRAPNRDVQLAHLTAYLVRDPVAFVTHDLDVGSGWEAKLERMTCPTIVVAGGPFPKPPDLRGPGGPDDDLVYLGAMTPASRPPVTDQKRSVVVTASSDGQVMDEQPPADSAERTRSRSFSDIVRSARRAPVDQKDHAIAEVIGVLRTLVMVDDGDAVGVVAAMKTAIALLRDTTP